MLKKNEVLEALENGGCIMVDSIYRTAHVLDADGERVDTCRYDTAERIEQTAGYKKTYSRGWYASWYIEKEQPAQEETADDIEEEATFAAWMDAGSDAWDADTLTEATAQEEQPAQDDRTPYERVISRDPDNKNAWRLPGYPGPLWRLCYTSGCYCTSYYPSKREMQDDLEQLPRQGGHDFHAAYRANPAAEWEEIPAETRQEETDRENHETCRRIAEDLEAHAGGRVYRCPECGETFECDDLADLERETEDFPGYVYALPCGCETTAEPEQQSLYDYFSDCLDIEYRCDAQREYRSVCVMVTCGGPNIYIDTAAKAVELYWWSDRASYSLLSDTVDAVDAWAAEYWECL